MPNAISPLRSLLARLGEAGRRRSPLLRRVPPLHDLLELAARVGYGARGFVYLSVGLLVLFATLGFVGDTVGLRGALDWLSQRPLGRVWMLLIGLGLAAFVAWRMLQAIFDADHEGTSRHGLMTRMSQLFSGLSYAALAFAARSRLSATPSEGAGARGPANRVRAAKARAA